MRKPGTLILLFGLAASAGATLVGGPSLLPVARHAPAGARVRKPSPAETKLMAQEIERRLAELALRLKEENAEFDRASLELITAAAGLDLIPPDSPQAQEAKKPLARVLDKYPKASLFLEMTILARRLRIYEETGELPADIPDAEDIRRLLENPWSALRSDPRTQTVSAPKLEQDILALMRQIERYHRLASPEKPREQLPAAALAPIRREAAPPRPELARDAGRGKPETEPVPELILLLASPDARQRALAADELGRSGLRGAAAALPALKAALADSDPRVRASAVLALASVGGPDVIVHVTNALRDPNEDVRFSARTALQRLPKQ